MPPKGTPASAASHALQEAQSAQQRGERRGPQEAIACWKQAAELYQQALQQQAGSGQAGGSTPGAWRPRSLAQPLTEDEKQEAWFGYAEVCQQWGDSVVEVVSTEDDSQLTPALEQAAREEACKLYEQGVAAYRQVVDPNTGLTRADAAVNAGNTLCSWAELIGQQQQQQQPSPAGAVDLTSQLELYKQAAAMYETALRQEEDALTFANYGDALMQQAEVLWEAGAREAGQCAASALQAYEQACSFTDSTDGDDLPGLLANWGTGLMTVAQHTTQAVDRLKRAVEFGRADPEPCVALGDALAAQAELMTSKGTGASGTQEGSSTVAPGAQAVALLQQALADGYEAALRINREHPRALIGAAEAQASLARLAAQAGAPDAAAHHLTQSLTCFEAALRQPSKLGGFQERCDVRYNYACVLALARREAEAAGLLGQLLACKGVSPATVSADEDLAGRPWVVALLSQLQEQA